MTEKSKNKAKKDGWGGARAGAGRPAIEENARQYNFRAGGELGKLLDQQEKRSEFIKDCIRKAVGLEPGQQAKVVKADFSQLGSAYAINDDDDKLPYFDVSVACGSPVDVFGGENAEYVSLLDVMGYDRESCYIIKAKGHSMIDADIHDGDVVVVDRSQLDASEDDVAVYELNGEYTIKRFRRCGNEGWLVPANPDYEEIHVGEDDVLKCWGVVRFVVHRVK